MGEEAIAIVVQALEDALEAVEIVILQTEDRDQIDLLQKDRFALKEN